MGHYVAIRNQMSNCQDDDLMALAYDLFGANSFIVDKDHYEVTESSPVAMTVEVAAGRAYVYCSSLVIHMRTLLDAAVTKTIDSNSSGSTRIDIICIKIDTAATADADGSNVATVEVVKGTPGAGVPATPANYYKLAEVTVADGETEITDAEIADTRNEFRKTIDLPAQAWSPTTTNGCAAVATVEAGTNDIDYKVLDFDKDSDENAFVNWKMPESYDGGPIRFKFIWTTASGEGGAAETVVFELSGRAYANDDAIDQAVGTAIEVLDTWIADGDLHESAWSDPVTLAGTPVGGQWVHLEIMRDVSEDDLGGDARLIGIQIEYGINRFSD